MRMLLGRSGAATFGRLQEVHAEAVTRLTERDPRGVVLLGLLVRLVPQRLHTVAEGMDALLDLRGRVGPGAVDEVVGDLLQVHTAGVLPPDDLVQLAAHLLDAGGLHRDGSEVGVHGGARRRQLLVRHQLEGRSRPRRGPRWRGQRPGGGSWPARALCRPARTARGRRPVPAWARAWASTSSAPASDSAPRWGSPSPPAPRRPQCRTRR